MQTDKSLSYLFGNLKKINNVPNQQNPKPTKYNTKNYGTIDISIIILTFQINVMLQFLKQIYQIKVFLT